MSSFIFKINLNVAIFKTSRLLYYTSNVWEDAVNVANQSGDRDEISLDHLPSSVSNVHVLRCPSTESLDESKAFITVWKATCLGNWGNRMVRGRAVSSMGCTWKLRPLSRVTR